MAAIDRHPFCSGFLCDHYHKAVPQQKKEEDVKSKKRNQLIFITSYCLVGGDNLGVIDGCGSDWPVVGYLNSGWGT